MLGNAKKQKQPIHVPLQMGEAHYYKSMDHEYWEVKAQRMRV